MQLKFPLLTIFQHEDWQKTVLRFFFFLKNLLQLLTFPDFQSPALMCSHKTSLVLTCATVQSGQPVRNHLNIREGVRIIHQTEIKDTDTHTHTRRFTFGGKSFISWHDKGNSPLTALWRERVPRLHSVTFYQTHPPSPDTEY